MTPEREFGGRSVGPGSGGAGGGFQHRADALQLESRLTEKLREHSLSATEGAARRPTGGPRSRMGTSMWPSHSWQEDSYVQHSGYQHSRFDPRSPNMDGGRNLSGGSGWGGPGGDRRGQLSGPPSASLTPQMEYGSRSGQRRPMESFAGGSSAALTPPQLRSDLSMTGLTESGGMPESRLKIYSDLFEEVIERDRVFGSLLRKIKTAYDMLLLRAPAVPPLPMDGSSFVHQGRVHEAVMDPHAWGGQDNRVPSSLHSNEPTTRAEGGQAWEMQRENRVLKDLVERLHLELEEAVRREHRWKQKVTKLKTKVDTSPPQAGAYGKVVDDWPSAAVPGHPDFYAQGGHLQPEDRGAGDAGKRTSSVPRFHPGLREPSLAEAYGQEGPLNQGGLLSLSSISPTASVPPLPESFAAESARSEDSGMLPQRPPRGESVKPVQVPRLDFSKLKDQLEDEEDEEETPGEVQYESRYTDEELDEMQAHGKITREQREQYALAHNDTEDEDACWPSFEQCKIQELGHICHPSEKAFNRPSNPVGYDDEDDDDEGGLPEGLSRHSH